jgi:DNA-binding HxlR family transcriptional regulator
MDARTEALQGPGMDPRLGRDTSNCSIARTFEVVGEKWTILILREVWCGSSRFSDFERVLGCPRNLLAARLRMSVEEGILATETYKEPGSRSRPKYVIMPKGMEHQRRGSSRSVTGSASLPTRGTQPP